MLRRFILFLLPIALCFGCASFQKGFKPDYLEYICGDWSETALLSDASGANTIVAKSTWTCRYDRKQKCYVASGELSVPGSDPVGFTNEYYRVEDNRANIISKGAEGDTTGGVKQVADNRVVQVMLGLKGKVSMRATTTFSADTMTTTATYYDERGKECLKGNVVAVRQQPAEK